MLPATVASAFDSSDGKYVRTGEWKTNEAAR